MRKVLLLIPLLLLASVCWAGVKSEVLVEVHWEWLHDSHGRYERGHKQWVGNGVFVAPNLVLTAGHLRPVPLMGEDPAWLDRLNTSAIRLVVRPYSSQDFYLVSVVYSDPVHDIMLLRVLGYRSAHWVSVGKPSLGKAEVSGFFAARGVRERFTIAAHIFIIRLPLRWGVEDMDLVQVIGFNPTVMPGTSGSPLIQRGKVVGIVVGATEDYAFAYPVISEVREVIRHQVTLLVGSK